MGETIGPSEARAIAMLMRLAGRPAFPAALRRMLRTKMAFRTFLILNYPANRPPTSEYHWIPDAALREDYTTHYLGGAYQLDPFFQYSLQPFRPGIYRLRDIAPDRFFASEYYQQYYQRTNLSDEVGALVPLSDGSVAGLSMSRGRTDPPYSKAELKGLRLIEPVLVELLRQHGEGILTGAGLRQMATLPYVLDEAIYHYAAKAHAPGLTRREAEIAALVLQGHSSLSASLILGISDQTVKVHRKNIYKKMQISSQAQLFLTLQKALLVETVGS